MCMCVCVKRCKKLSRPKNQIMDPKLVRVGKCLPLKI